MFPHKAQPVIHIRAGNAEPVPVGLMQISHQFPLEIRGLFTLQMQKTFPTSVNGNQTATFGLVW